MPLRGRGLCDSDGHTRNIAAPMRLGGHKKQTPLRGGTRGGGLTGFLPPLWPEGPATSTSPHAWGPLPGRPPPTARSTGAAAAAKACPQGTGRTSPWPTHASRQAPSDPPCVHSTAGQGRALFPSIFSRHRPVVCRETKCPSAPPSWMRVACVHTPIATRPARPRGPPAHSSRPPPEADASTSPASAAPGNCLEWGSPALCFRARRPKHACALVH